MIGLHVVLFEPHLLHRGELAEAFAASPNDPASPRVVAARFATLSYAERASTDLQRYRFIPVGEGDSLHPGPTARTRH